MTDKFILHIVAPTVDFSCVVPESLLLKDGDVPSRVQHHSSLGDASFGYLLEIVARCQKIIFHPSGFKPGSEEHNSVVLLLAHLSHRYEIENFTPTPPIDLLNINLGRSVRPCLWVFGCSHSYGVGLNNETERYSNILAESLATDLELRAAPGSSLSWSLGCIYQSEIKDNDLVVWQITTPGRMSKYKNNRIHHTRLSEYPALLDFFDDEQIFFEHVKYLQQGIAYLRAKKVHFVITSIMDEGHNWFHQYHVEYVKYPEYCHAPDIWIDWGWDHVHAGPLSNQLLANRLKNHLQYVYG